MAGWNTSTKRHAGTSVSSREELLGMKITDFAVDVRTERLGELVARTAREARR